MARVVTPADRGALDTLSSALPLPNPAPMRPIPLLRLVEGADAATHDHRRMTPDSRARGTRRPAAVLASAALLCTLGMAGTSSASASAPSVVVEAADWAWPVRPPLRVIAPFLAPPTPYSAGHRGIDIQSTAGAEVRAPARGVVTFAGPVAGRGVVAIDHGSGIVSAIEPVAAGVAAGATVDQGDLLGRVAGGGHCDGTCVHFGVRLHGEYVSPLLFLGGVPRAVLLPMG